MTKIEYDFLISFTFGGCHLANAPSPSPRPHQRYSHHLPNFEHILKLTKPYLAKLNPVFQNHIRVLPAMFQFAA